MIKEDIQQKFMVGPGSTLTDKILYEPNEELLYEMGLHPSQKNSNEQFNYQ